MGISETVRQDAAARVNIMRSQRRAKMADIEAHRTATSRLRSEVEVLDNMIMAYEADIPAPTVEGR